MDHVNIIHATLVNLILIRLFMQNKHVVKEYICKQFPENNNVHIIF